MQQELKDKDQKIASLETDIAVSVGELKGREKQEAEKLRLLINAREELSNHFKVLAHRVLEEKSERFQSESKSSINEVLSPLQERLREFQQKIQENYETAGKERYSLKQEVQRLMEMNQRLSEEATNLTRALKGENKTQGNWGEMILERILEVAGLRKGEGYTLQESFTDAQGARQQPDVVIHLPEGRHMIIDSKVTLVSYEAYTNAENKEQKQGALKAHLASLKGHIEGLSGKEYQKLHGESSPDFVMMFIPIEPAFLLAVSEEPRLWERAWERNILLVSPSTLLFVMRTVAQLWKQENQNRNALEIAKRGALLYEKLADFTEAFESIGLRLHQAEKSFETAKKRLTTGRGNLINQAKKLKELGVSPTKEISLSSGEEEFNLQDRQE